MESTATTTLFAGGDEELASCAVAAAEGRAAGRLAGFGDGLALGVSRGLQAGQRMGFFAMISAAEAARAPAPLPPRAFALVSAIAASASSFPLENVHVGSADAGSSTTLDVVDLIENVAARTKALLALCSAPALAPARLAAAADPVTATAQAARVASGAPATPLAF